jgi:putative hydrolase of the HAD superfamily
MNNIKTIIFDFGGVLVNLNMQVCVDAFARLGYDKMDELLDNYKQKGIFLLFEEGKISTDDFFVELQQIVGKHTPIEEIKKAYLTFIEDIPAYKLDLILKLRQKYNILLLSNINPFIFDYCKDNQFKSQGYVFEDYFLKAYLSFEMGVCKPDKLIFEKMIEDANLVPEQCLFLDDGVKNIEIAQSIGFQTYLVKPQEDFSYLFEK